MERSLSGRQAKLGGGDTVTTADILAATSKAAGTATWLDIGAFKRAIQAMKPAS
jgi:hypothetical protein